MVDMNAHFPHLKVLSLLGFRETTVLFPLILLEVLLSFLCSLFPFH